MNCNQFAQCKFQEPLCCLGLGFPFHRVSLRQIAASPGVAEETVFEMQNMGRIQPLAYFCAMLVPVFVCL